jgi:uncharacterized protein (TIGR02246 family)
MAAAAFTTPQEAEQAFYDAFQRADLDAMMAVWAQDEEVFCVHPGGGRLSSLEAIRVSFSQIFAAGPTMRFEIRAAQSLQGGLIAVHSVYEYITMLGDRGPATAVVATNVYANVGGGWRMVAHHGSPAGEQAERAQTQQMPPPGLLH